MTGKAFIQRVEFACEIVPRRFFQQLPVVAGVVDPLLPEESAQHGRPPAAVVVLGDVGILGADAFGIGVVAHRRGAERAEVDVDDRRGVTRRRRARVAGGQDVFLDASVVDQPPGEIRELAPVEAGALGFVRAGRCADVVDRVVEPKGELRGIVVGEVAWEPLEFVEAGEDMSGVVVVASGRRVGGEEPLADGDEGQAQTQPLAGLVPSGGPAVADRQDGGGGHGRDPKRFAAGVTGEKAAENPRFVGLATVVACFVRRGRIATRIPPPMLDKETIRRNRREFIKRATAAVAAPTIVPASALGRGGKPAPSERITMGVVGWGMMGPGNTRNFMNEKDCQVVAACDVDKAHLEAAVSTVNGRYRDGGCAAYSDYREMLARDDIDAVMLAVPDNWHCLMSVEAAKAGKDIYGEKPLARTLREQQAIVKAVQENGRVWQTGSWQRSVDNFLKGAEIVRNGLIGKVSRVEVGLPAGHHDFAGTKDKVAVTDPPERLDYEAWIGPAQMEPYIEARVHKNWRWNYNIGGGQLLDWIGHHCDIAHWGMGWDDTGPAEVEGEGEFPVPDAMWNTATKYRVECRYPDGTPMTIAGGHRDIRGGTRWIGEDGWVQVNRGHFSASDDAWVKMKRLPEAERREELYYSPGHHRNFLDCIKSRKPTITPVDVAHRSAVPGHLGLIAMLTGRKIQWDPVKEEIIGDEAASELMGRVYRGPWAMP